jgi:nitrous oxide reductase accessory protein NosL
MVRGHMHLCLRNCKIVSVFQQELTSLRILEVNGVDAEIVPTDKLQPKWWSSRKSGSGDAEAAAAAVA